MALFSIWLGASVSPWLEPWESFATCVSELSVEGLRAPLVAEQSHEVSLIPVSGSTVITPCL